MTVALRPTANCENKINAHQCKHTRFILFNFRTGVLVNADDGFLLATTTALNSI